MTNINLALFASVLTILLIGLVSRPLQRSVFSRPLLAMLVGIVMGPQVLAAVEVPEASQFDLVEAAARLSLAVALMATALELPRLDLLRRWRTVSVLLAAGMAGMWLASASVIWLITGFSFELALIAGAIVTPTDPILARSVTEGELAHRTVPERIRYTLLQESAINDGLAYPFVFLALAIYAADPLATEWLPNRVLWAVVAAIAVGAAAGFCAGRLLVWVEDRGWIEPEFFFSYALALSLVTVTGGYLAGMDGILIVFAAGTAFSAATNSHERDETDIVQSSISSFFMLPVFFVFGLMLPWDAWGDLGWKAFAIPAGVLLLRRLPVVLLLSPLLRRQLTSLGEAAFAGWFGPIGISAFFYVALVVGHSGLEELWPLVSLVIFASTIAFALTTPILSQALERHRARTQDATTADG